MAFKEKLGGKNGEKIGGKKGEQDGWEARAQLMANHILIKIDFQTRPTKRREENIVCARKTA